jgi:hypothetical protein
LSKDTITPRISDMWHNIGRVVEICPSCWVDGPTEVAYVSHKLLAYMRYVHNNDRVIEFLFCKSLETKMMTRNIFKKVLAFVEEPNSEWKTPVQSLCWWKRFQVEMHIRISSFN